MLVDIWEGTEPRPDATTLGVRGVPTNVVVDSDGTVRAFGAARLDELEQAIDDLYCR